jgi:CubicO group peptidase (beta-lactamase class C family)
MTTKISFAVIFCLSFGAFAQSNIDKTKQFENGLTTVVQIRDSTINRYNIEDRMKSYKVPAVSVAIIDKGKIVLAKTYGEADITSHRKADSTTLFHVASISKTINALCIMKLVEENKLSLTSDFRDYIKDGSFKENQFSKGEKITIANLLSHTAGIVRDDGPSGDYTAAMKLPTITQIVAGKKPALGKGAYSIRKPNEVYQYSNQGVCITQKILEDNIDGNYHHLMNRQVFEPLQMTNSTFEVIRMSEVENSIAKGYYADLKEVKPWSFPCPAQGGLVSTATGIAKVVIAIQNSYQEKSNIFLKKESITQMFTPQLPDSVTHKGELDLPYKNGLGLMIFEKGGKKYFTHAGTIDGYTSVFVGECEGQKGAVILLNSVNARIIPEILNSIATTFEWKDYVQYNYKK